MTDKIPTPKRQVAMVLDLNKCLGCHTCSVACKKLWNTDDGTDYSYWNNVETAPGKGFPAGWQEMGGGFDEDGQLKPGRIPDLETEYGRAWSFNHKNVLATDQTSKKKEWLRPKGDPKWGHNWDEDHGAGQYPQENHYFYLPRLCNHCERPGCLAACPRKAIYKREEDGIVLVDQDRCRGYRFCVEACPYKKVYFDYDRQVSSKCIFCMPRIEEGTAPACARQCPGRLRFVGYRDDKDGPIHKLVDQYKVAIPLHPDYGTSPNVFYVPPMSPPKLDNKVRPTGKMRIPMSYLESLFGDAVHGAMEALLAERAKRKQGQPSELMKLLIAYDWNKSFKLDEKNREAS